jgi:hypothetical protein
MSVFVKIEQKYWKLYKKTHLFLETMSLPHVQQIIGQFDCRGNIAIATSFYNFIDEILSETDGLD